MARLPVLLLVLSLCVLQGSAALSFNLNFARHRHFARDVRIALRALATPAASAPPRRRAVTKAASGKCIAVRTDAQVPLPGPGGGSSGGAPGNSSPAPAPTSSSIPSTPPPDPPSPPPTSTANPGSGNAGSSPRPGSPGNSSGPSPWKIAQYYAGQSFFQGWDFWTLPDPTAGTVQYVDENTARSNNLIETNGAGNAIMRVDTTPVIQGNRMSVRITTQYAYTGALVILDAVHMPTGCGTWPAFWSNGPTWPVTGEIDIVEGVNDQVNNQATIHTRAGCTIPSTNAAVGATGTMVNGFNCDVAATQNAGCGTVLPDGANYGAAFNAAGGGVYAMLWDETAISVWFFPRSRIPNDIANRAPQPGAWGTPFARWPGSSCNTMDFFKNHNAIFDTTFCGDWAGNVWGQSCAAKTGVATCSDFVRQHGDAFAEAYWEVKSVAIYQRQ